MGGGGDNGTIIRAWNNKDGVTCAHIKTAAGGGVGRTCYGHLQVRSELLSDLIGLRVRLSDGGGLWVLTTGRQ